MLIKLTNQCSMLCPHCMDDAQEKGQMMTLDTFKNAVRFGKYIGDNHFALSGGEPTENEHILKMCEWLTCVTNSTFTIVSNGMWLKDEEKRLCVEKITRMLSYIGMQVYTNKKWYKEYDYVVSHKHEYEKYDNVIVDIDAPIFMQDLGRARTNPEAQREVEENPHFMSCLNTVLVAIQTANPREFGFRMMLHRQFCKPSVDCLGNVHMSESRLCPSVGNVNTDSFDDIWQRMREFRPCGHCKQYRKFMESPRADIAAARAVMGL